MKPPILRRLEAKPQQSEIFYNSDNKQNKTPAKNVSKSCNDMENVRQTNNSNRPQLQDSLKIFRNIHPVSVSRV